MVLEVRALIADEFVSVIICWLRWVKIRLSRNQVAAGLPLDGIVLPDSIALSVAQSRIFTAPL
jgi:hypothetical protein